MKEDNIIGDIYESNDYGKFEVIDFSHKIKYHKYYKVRFFDTGNIDVFSRSNIVRGRVKDCMRKSIYGVACKGRVKTTKGSFQQLMYNRWHRILSKIYNQNDSHYNSYGAKGVTLSKEWLCFENFYNDIINLDGFDLDKVKSGELELDKDFNQQGVVNKIYSKDSCVWRDRQENNEDQDSIQQGFIATSPLGDVIFGKNIRKFAREYDLKHESIRRVLKGEMKQTHGWKFSYK